MIITSYRAHLLLHDYFDGRISDKEFSKQIWKAVDREKEMRLRCEARLAGGNVRDPQTIYR